MTLRAFAATYAAGSIARLNDNGPVAALQDARRAPLPSHINLPRGENRMFLCQSGRYVEIAMTTSVARGCACAEMQSVGRRSRVVSALAVTGSSPGGSPAVREHGRRDATPTKRRYWRVSGGRRRCRRRDVSRGASGSRRRDLPQTRVHCRRGKAARSGTPAHPRGRWLHLGSPRAGAASTEAYERNARADSRHHAVRSRRLRREPGSRRARAARCQERRTVG